MNPQIRESLNKLPDHHQLFERISSFFEKVPGIVGLIVSGSVATGRMDSYSDLDLGFLCEDEQVRTRIWNDRWHWKISPWFHRFDADHIKPHFVIYFFEPNIHVDFNFYVKADLPSSAGGPFVVAWDKSGTLNNWSQKVNAEPCPKPDWSEVVHENERFWAWIHYISSHAARGEYYDTVTFLKDLRLIVETWEARLMGYHQFDSRRVEQKFSTYFLQEMSQTFCLPNRDAIKMALASLIQAQLRQRREIEKARSPNWTLKPEAITRIRAFSETLNES